MCLTSEGEKRNLLSSQKISRKSSGYYTRRAKQGESSNSCRSVKQAFEVFRKLFFEKVG